MATLIEKQFKYILSQKKTIDSWFQDCYNINPYSECLIGYIYCDVRRNQYHMPTDFENNMVVK